MEFIGEFKVTEFGDKTRYVTIKGDRENGSIFILEDGSELPVGDLKYIANDGGLWRVTNAHEIVQCTEEEVEFLYVDSFRNSPMTHPFAHANWEAEFEYIREDRDAMLKERDEALAKVAELEKEIVELKKAPKTTAKKKAEESANESERLPSGTEEVKS